ncbi:MAG: hypothetical protein OXJ55_13930 [Caldilineaceae bacterium]|nr:hypothetical protein [Caldilineaceae bacterium]MDE0499988.1 hypothetical protein [bacterium]
MRKLAIAAAFVVVTSGVVTAQEESAQPEHFPQWMIEESYLLRATALVSVEEVVCGPLYRNAGKTILVETLDGRQVQDWADCGGVLPIGGWRTGSHADELDGSSTTWATLFSDGRIGSRYDHPELGIQCRDDTLGIYVFTGGYVAASVWSDRVAVKYRFGDGGVVEQGWHELISGGDDNVGAWMPSSYRRSFVNSLRDNPEGALVFRMWNYDNTEVGTMTFDLTGVQRVVEPILQECGW